MTRILVSARAQADVDQILYRLAELAGPTVATKYARDLSRIYETLMMFPAIGAKRPRLGPKARIALWRPYLIVYDHIDDQVVVVRVIDGRRNITRGLIRQ